MLKGALFVYFAKAIAQKKHALKPFAMRNFIFSLLLFPLLAFAQKREVFRIDSLPKEGILLNQGWKWHAGDNPEWAKAEYDDAKWEDIDPTKDIHALPQVFNAQVKWLRLTFDVTNKLTKPLGLSINQAGASEIYINGQLLQQIGHIDKDSAKVKAVDPLEFPINFPLDTIGKYHLAIRYSLQPNINYTRIYGWTQNCLFKASIVDLMAAQKGHREFRVYYTGLEIFRIGLLFMLFVLHFSFYFYQKQNKTHLLLAIYFLGALLQYVLKIVGQNQFSVEARFITLNTSLWCSAIGNLFGLTAFYKLSKVPRDIHYKIMVAIVIVSLVVSSMTYGLLWFTLVLITAFLNFLIMLRLTRIGVKNKIKGFAILGIGVMISSLGFLIIGLRYLNFPISPYLADVTFNLSAISLPIGLSLFMGVEAAEITKALRIKLTENEELKDQTLAQEKEKQELLATQNETLEHQVTERTAEILEKNRELQVEASLDRVRARALSMQQSNEVMDVADTLYEELQKLDFKYGASTIMIMHDENSNMEHWVAGFDHLKYPESYHVNYFKNPCYDAQFEAWRNGQKYLVYILAGDEKKAYDEQMFEHNDYKKFPAAEQQWMRAGESVIFSLAFMKHGALHWGPTPLSEEKAQVLQRFAAVFEQAYTRFLDLQKAEVQAREAQIEVALERIRAKALAMESSTQINTVIAIIYRECNTLLLDLTASLIIIYNEDTLDTCWYLAKQEDPDFPSGFKISHNQHPFSLAMLDGWKQKSNDWEYILKADEKIAWDDFIFSETDFSLLPDIVRNAMRSAHTLYTCAAFGHFGCIMLGTLNANNKEQKIILSRITNVFDFAYTRFEDLQQKEKLAKQAEEDLIKLKEEKRKTDQAITELKSTQAQLIQSEKLASLGELTAGIAHEIQNPLNFVNNFAEVSAEMLDEMHEELEKGDTTEAIAIAADLKTNLEKINHHGKRASSIVKGMLEHSRASTGTKVAIDLNALSDEYLRLAYHGLRAKDNNFNATMETHFDPDLSKIEVIPQDIGRVLLNLINNAFYAVAERSRSTVGAPLAGAHVPYQPTVTITTRKLADAIEITVQDNGNGIPDAIKDKIFQPFFTTKPTGQGTGLGLSLAYDIVTKGHGGSLAVESTPGDGTSFVIQLPINEANL